MHTLGPWTAIYTLVKSAGPEPIRVVDTASGADGMTFEAACDNARLIASAPDLLAVLRDLMSGAHQCGRDCDMNKPCPLTERARAVIATAEGV